MFSILREFYLGNVSPSENLRPEHPLYKEKSKLANDLEVIFMANLSDEEKENYREITNNRGLSYCEEVHQAFIDGFVLGFLFCEELTERRGKYAEN